MFYIPAKLRVVVELGPVFHPSYADNRTSLSSTKFAIKQCTPNYLVEHVELLSHKVALTVIMCCHHHSWQVNHSPVQSLYNPSAFAQHTSHPRLAAFS